MASESFRITPRKLEKCEEILYCRGYMNGLLRYGLQYVQSNDVLYYRQINLCMYLFMCITNEG
jgi:uncharacterized membrane protein